MSDQPWVQFASGAPTLTEKCEMLALYKTAHKNARLKATDHHTALKLAVEFGAIRVQLEVLGQLPKDDELQPWVREWTDYK